MKKLHLVLLGLLLAGGLTAQTTPPEGIIDKTPELKAFTNARIFVSPETVIDSGVLVIDRGKIVDVGTSVDIPDGATVIDLAGLTVYPGFVEPYAEYGLDAAPPPHKKRRRNAPPVYDTERVGCNAWNAAIHAERNWVEYFQPDSKAAESFLELGFTSVQSAHLDGIFRGRAFVTSLGNGLPNDLVIRPHGWQFVSFHKGSSIQEYPSSQMGAIALIRQTLLDADWYRKARAAHARNHGQAMPEFNTAIEALATIGNEKVVFATPDKLALLRADKIAREFGLNAVHLGSGLEFERIEEVKATGRTLILPVDFPDAPEVESIENELDITLQKLRRWDWAPSNPAVLEENGVTFAFTTHGLEKKCGFLDNVRRAIERGLSQTTALAALTTVPAEVCGVGNLVGSLEPGKLADFVVCNGGIFDKETVIFAVYTHGEKREFVSYDETAFAGYYVGQLAGKDIALRLEDDGNGEKRRVKGEFKADDISVKLDNVSVDRDKLQFSARLDTLDIDGIARFAVRKVIDSLIGRVAFADGSRQTWLAVMSDEPAEDTTSDVDSSESDEPEEIEKDEPDAPIARITYPNMAFGYETIPQPENVLVRNGTVWTSEADGILENTDMLIKDGKIEAIGRDLTAPSGYRVIDAADKHVAAGIIDQHSHICISGDVNEGTSAITAEARIGDIIRSDDIAVYRSLAGGTTTTRTTHGSANPIGSQAQDIKLRWGVMPEAMKFVEGPPSIKFALGENVKQCNWGDQFNIRYPQTRMGVETIIKDIFNTALEYEADWKAYDALGRKDREKTVPPRRDLRLETILEILKGGRAIDCHAYVQSEILMLMRLAEEFGIRVQTFIHILEGYKVADEMAKHGATGGSIPDWWAYKFEVYDAIPHGPKIMHDHGVIVSINSDSQQLQRLLNQAAAKSVQYADMSQEDAWNMVTINPAKQLEADQWIGSLKVGKQADFVIWSGNPLSIYSHVEQTWVDGRKFFDIETDRLARQAAVEEKNKLIQKVLSKPAKKNKKHDGGKKPGLYSSQTEGGGR